MKKSMKKLKKAVKKMHIAETKAVREAEGKEPLPSIVFDKELNPALLAKWPKLKKKIPAIFLHRPVDFESQVRKLLSLGAKFYRPLCTPLYYKITCPTVESRKKLLDFFDKREFPYHTFGNPLKKKLKVVIRGLPSSTDLNILKQELKSSLLPVLRVHQMSTQFRGRPKLMMVLVVVPYNEKGLKLLTLRRILGHDVTLEPLHHKREQCFKCQRWGHCQRYCRGRVKCVKCAEEHSIDACTKGADFPPKCANCKENHTANFRQCIYCPQSTAYKFFMKKKKARENVEKAPELVTLDNCHTLFRNVDYSSRSKKAEN